VAAGAAVGVGLTTGVALGRDLGPVAMLVLTAGSAGLVAGAALLVLDREARSWLGLVHRKLATPRGGPVGG
jgi:hypothetical protein